MLMERGANLNAVNGDSNSALILTAADRFAVHGDFRISIL